MVGGAFGGVSWEQIWIKWGGGRGAGGSEGVGEEGFVADEVGVDLRGSEGV